MKLRRFQRKVENKQRLEALPVKDLVVMIPLLASSLAISFEVGRFGPTSGFLYFSLSEHLLAAIYALPAALVLSTLLAVLVIPFWACWTKSSGRALNPRQFESLSWLPRLAQSELSDGPFLETRPPLSTPTTRFSYSVYSLWWRSWRPTFSGFADRGAALLCCPCLLRVRSSSRRCLASAIRLSALTTSRMDRPVRDQR